MEWLLLSVGLIVGGVIGWHMKPDKSSVDRNAISKATKDLDEGSTGLKKTVDKHHL